MGGLKLDFSELAFDFVNHSQPELGCASQSAKLSQDKEVPFCKSSRSG